jgi:AraC-like DNA-binding protein
MNYLTVKEAGEKWELDCGIVMLYCAEGQIPGAVKKGGLWLIPQNALKPDGRGHDLPSSEKEIAVSKDIYDLFHQRKNNCEWLFDSLYENKDLFVEIVKRFPYPMHICAPDGTLLLANEEFLKFAGISNPQRLYKKHNILLNPALERWGIKDFMLQAYQGEVVHIHDVKVPLQEINQRLGDDNKSVDGSMFQNMTAFPIRDKNDRLLYIVTVFTTSRHYHGREEIIKGKEYIDDYWQEEFDANKLAEVVHMSKYHYSRLFRQHTGLTPHQYYLDVKVAKLKEKLCDSNLSVAQAFADCGVDYNGNYAKLFKQRVGMTPAEYQKMMTL